jgi:alpha-amylase
MKKILGLLFVVLMLMAVVPAFSAVMMQGFYWDVPAGGTWYNTMKAQAGNLRKMVASTYGINRMYFPPPSKAQGGGYSMGYDPYDYYDLGQLTQMGTTKTRFGSQAELKSAIAAYTTQGVISIADIVPNHRSGGNSEWNPKRGANTWTDFTTVKSGKAKWRWDSFHPNNYCGGDPGVFAGFSDICYSAGLAYNDMITWLSWLRSTTNAGFGGWRFDYVKGVHAWVVKDLKQKTGNLWSVSELWDSNTTTLNNFVNASDTSVFDFALYYTMNDAINGSGWMPDIFNTGKSYAARNPMRAVTFVANHDTDIITNNKMLAYAIILTYQGYPCIFWKDYFNYGLATGGGAGTGWGNGIKQLVWCREKLAGGSPSIQILYSGAGDHVIYGSYGTSTSAPGYIVIVNRSTSWKGRWVQTGNGYLKNKTLKAYAWLSTVSGQNYAPANKFCDSNGWVEVWAAPKGYAVYSVNGF